MHTSGPTWELGTIGQDVRMMLLTLSSALSASFPIHRRSTGGWPIFMFGRARFRRPFAPYEWFFRKMAVQEGECSRSQRTRRATETHFWKCFLLSLLFSLTT